MKYIVHTKLGYKVGPRLRELAPAARGSQEEGFTQPRAHLKAQLCILYDTKLLRFIVDQ